MSETPFFIVGVPRSGTTLLRQMLRGHPRLAIPLESHFVPAALAAPTGPAALDLILADDNFRQWGLDPDLVRRRAAATDGTPAAVVQSAFEAYADAEGKSRWGDKTPLYVRHMPLLAAAFPGAQFVHIIRDGREVTTSMRDAWWGPNDLAFAAQLWRRTIAQARKAAGTLAPQQYLEVRYDRLVTAPQVELTRILDFLGEDIVDGLLDYRERVAAELPRLPHEHRHLLEPPTERIRDWRASCSPAEQERLNALLAPTLRLLGLGPEPAPSPLRRAEAELMLLRLRAQRRLTRR